ncbi:pilus assembly protein [Roseomonas hellenica]|uniref:Pilus assembly protein n=1 Tax=Plastoroseomonas hellenica TaxID=2687306 RepID=A0ABS5EVA8_9PROT|nr:TadE/TadG family type IV pilus assembly protein [Plastoroseomonas hellenica]MBR0664233.1 pilus assembly protein [Plastoroseomonas hellenica]
MTLGRFRGDRRGNVAILTALIAVVLFGSAGLAIDATRAWMLRSRLATSLDAAALTAARGYSAGMATGPTSDLGKQACAVFWANFGVSSTTNPCGTTNEGRGFLRAMSTNPAISVGAENVLTVTATARLDTTFMRLLGIDRVVTTTASAAIRTVTSLEIALALDVTASMYPVGNNDKIGALRTAATNFVTAIYGSQETRENTWVSITPYTTHVNIGTASYAQAMVTAASRAQFDGLYDSRGTAVSWLGCIEARWRQIGGSTYGDLTDVPPNSTDPNTMFRAWFYPTTLNNASTPESLYSRTVNGTTYYYPGDNDWRSYIPGNSAVNGRAINEWALNQNTTRPGAPQGGATQNPLDITGPHLGCLLEPRYVVLPLTAGRTTLINRINGLEAEPWQWHRYRTGTQSITHGGTVIHLGLQMAWLTISPRWTDLWGLPRTPNNRTLPLTADVAGQKVIVLMTDGNNEFYPNVRTWYSDSDRPDRGAPAGCEDNTTARTPRHPLVCNPFYRDSRDQKVFVYRTANDTGYGPYGRLSTGGLVNIGTGQTVNVLNFGTDGDNIQDDAVLALNDRLRRLCTNIKNGGVRIYTVGFAIGSNSTANDLLRDCANTPQDYFLASDAATLNAAFVEIANRVGRVRLVR